MSVNETAEEMRKLAERAVGLAVKAGMKLDYSETSLQAVDAYVGQLHGFLNSPENTWTEKMKWGFALAYGGYVGEVVRRAAGGEWVAGTLVPDPKLAIGIVELTPVTKVLRRMNNGIEDHLPHYVESVLRGAIPASMGKTGRVVVG